MSECGLIIWVRRGREERRGSPNRSPYQPHELDYVRSRRCSCREVTSFSHVPSPVGVYVLAIQFRYWIAFIVRDRHSVCNSRMSYIRDIVAYSKTFALSVTAWLHKPSLLWNFSLCIIHQVCKNTWYKTNVKQNGALLKIRGRRLGLISFGVAERKLQFFDKQLYK